MNPKLEKSLETALDGRLSHLENLKKTQTNCYRFFSGGKEGIGGLKIDIYKDVGFLQQFVGQEDYRPEELRDIADWILKKLALKSVHLKRFIEDRTKTLADEELLPAEPLAGEKALDAFEVLENGLKFEIRPFDGFSTGIFLDQRDNREWVRKTANGKKVLNAFSYTCAFSVYAASGGATVTSVDLSQKYLDWGKKNFTLNGLDLNSHRFYAWDIFEFLKKAHKQKDLFDVVILDPPSFSRSKNGVFSIKKDWENLLGEALSVLAPGGTLYYSCNYFEWDQGSWEKKLGMALGDKKHTRIPLPKIPQDFQKEDHLLNSWAISLLS